MTLTLTPMPETASLNLSDLRSANPSARTEVSTQTSEPNYKEAAEAPSVTDLKPVAVQNTIAEPRKTSQGEAGVSAGRSFRGVVDQIETDSSNVTLHYDGRDNEFVLPTLLLEAAGIAYIGALFEIVMKKEAGLHSYDIVHLRDEEIRMRQAAPPADLSFLDGLEAPARRK